MSACPCCSRPRPLDMPIIGIQKIKDNVPALILWNCQCGTTRAIPWMEATYAQRVEAGLVELTRESRNEMSVWKGER